MRVVLAHDYLTQRGGAERVALALTRTFAGAPLLTAVYDPAATYPDFASVDVRTSLLDHIPAFRSDPRRALPLLPLAWRSLRAAEADLVVCSSSGWSHGIRTAAPVLVYCHNPARWLYQQDEYFRDRSRGVAGAASVLTPHLRRWDRRRAEQAHTYVANSSVVAARIKRTYGIEADVVPPPAMLRPDGPEEPLPGIEPGYLLTVGRARGYKNTDLVAEAVEGLRDERLVAVGGLPAPADRWSSRLVGVRGISDAQLRWLYRHAAALIAVSHEDFGLTPVEAYGFGTPALVLSAGGYLDSSVPGLTGEFVEATTPSAVQAAVRRFRSSTYDGVAIQKHAEAYSVETFSRTMEELGRRLVAG